MNGDHSNNPPPLRQSPAHPARAPRGLLLVTVTLAIVLVALVADRRGDGLLGRPQADPRTIEPRRDFPADEQATIDLFERCSRSVVYISPIVTRRRPTFFGIIEDTYEGGTGSGFIWDDSGHVVTNYHVIQGASSCTVTLPDNTAYDATLVGQVRDKDIAVLRIDAPREVLAPIAVGTSADLRVGQKIFAIGNPYGLDFTLTTGVVSALNRSIRAPSGMTIQGVIQADAAINPGNSGGPLLDSSGRLIGMNTAIYSPSGANAGIGFAIPVDTINRIVPQLITHGRVIRPGLGVQPANDSLTRRFVDRGVLILTVQQGSSAEAAGLRGTGVSRNGRIIFGDVILAINGVPTPHQDALFHALEKHEIGETVPVTLQRNGKRITVDVTLQGVASE